MDTAADVPTRTASPSAATAAARGRRGRLLLPLLAATTLLAACGGDDAGSFGMEDAVVSMPAPEVGMPDVGMAESMPGLVDEGRTSGDLADRAVDERAIVRTASIELVVDDGAVAIDAVVERTADFDGEVSSTNLSRDEDGTVSGNLVLRVPEERLDAFVDALDALARAVPFRSVDEVDVTLELSDLDARLENLRAFEDELRALLAEVRERDGTVEGLIAVSDRLQQVRTEIDLIEGRRIQLADRVTLSTVYVTVRQARSATPVIGTWDLPTVVRDALAATVRLGQLVVEGVIWFVLTVLPALVVLGVVVVLVRTVRRRRADAQDAGTGAGAA